MYTYSCNLNNISSLLLFIDTEYEIRLQFANKNWGVMCLIVLTMQHDPDI